MSGMPEWLRSKCSPDGVIKKDSAVEQPIAGRRFQRWRSPKFIVHDVPPEFNENSSCDPIAKGGLNATIRKAINRQFWNKFPFLRPCAAYPADISFIVY